MGSIKNLPPALAKIVPEDKIAELFDVLDTDNSNEVSEEEFISGVLQLVLSDVSFDTFNNLQILKQLRLVQDDMFVEVRCAQHDVKSAQEEMKVIHKRLAEMIGEI